MNFTIENQELRFSEEPYEFVNRTRNYIKCNFDFITDDWKDIVKIAVFYNDKEQEFLRYIDLDEEGFYSCEVPYDALIGDYFKICLYGGDLITTQLLTIPLKRSGYRRPHQCSVDNKDIFVDIFDLINSNNESTIEKLNFLEEHRFTNVTFEDDNLVFSNAEDVELTRVDLHVESTVSENIKLGLFQLSNEILSKGV